MPTRKKKISSSSEEEWLHEGEIDSSSIEEDMSESSSPSPKRKTKQNLLIEKTEQTPVRRSQRSRRGAELKIKKKYSLSSAPKARKGQAFVMGAREALEPEGGSDGLSDFIEHEEDTTSCSEENEGADDHVSSDDDKQKRRKPATKSTQNNLSKTKKKAAVIESSSSEDDINKIKDIISNGDLEKSASPPVKRKRLLKKKDLLAKDMQQPAAVLDIDTIQDEKSTAAAHDNKTNQLDDDDDDADIIKVKVNLSRASTCKPTPLQRIKDAQKKVLESNTVTYRSSSSLMDDDDDIDDGDAIDDEYDNSEVDKFDNSKEIAEERDHDYRCHEDDDSTAHHYRKKAMSSRQSRPHWREEMDLLTVPSLQEKELFAIYIEYLLMCLVEPEYKEAVMASPEHKKHYSSVGFRVLVSLFLVVSSKCSISYIDDRYRASRVVDMDYQHAFIETISIKMRCIAHPSPSLPSFPAGNQQDRVCCDNSARCSALRILAQLLCWTPRGIRISTQV